MLMAQCLNSQRGRLVALSKSNRVQVSPALACCLTPTDFPTIRVSSLHKNQMEPTEHIIQFFAYEHLPHHLQVVSKPFGVMAATIVDTLPRNPERTVALRKLL